MGREGGLGEAVEGGVGKGEGLLLEAKQQHWAEGGPSLALVLVVAKSGKGNLYLGAGQQKERARYLGRRIDGKPKAFLS